MLDGDFCNLENPDSYLQCIDHLLVRLSLCVFGGVLYEVSESHLNVYGAKVTAVG